jgi:hypothetical protein
MVQLTHAGRLRAVDIQDGTNLDWNLQYAVERQRILKVRQNRGFEGALIKLWDSAAPWLVIAVCGRAKAKA